ncbi:MAG: radical SAM protein [Candidatus Thermoplasmatota archaeon]|nr:radical SAM protein [Candidatus Thermoplasmatota archaeon]MBU1941129.1 radical SAM protein [Candidatus Thermoplasmatota archaeon]
MKSFIPWLNDSAYIPPLSPGCIQCAKGAKMVILITGTCPAHCYYCPLSEKKCGHDVIYADEWQLQHETQTTILLKEAQAITAEGAGITGGDPLSVWKRTRNYIRLLKKNFGSPFHIHLYTSGLINANHIPDLTTAGLDEIRFHPIPETWGTMETSPIKNAITTALETSLDVALEIPVLPYQEQSILTLINWADKLGIKWINLNELEFSEQNADALLARGYHVKHELSAAVQESQTTALQILNIAHQKKYSIGIHYCSVSFKDGIQLRNRITRRAHNTAKPYEIITEDGTLLKGIITSSEQTLRSIRTHLIKHYHVPTKYLYINKEKNRVELASWILHELAQTLTTRGYNCFLIEEYPTADHLETERMPLP